MSYNIYINSLHNRKDITIMTRAEIKARAKAQLGGSIFSNNWLYAVLVVIIETALVGAINAIPGVGTIASLLITGPIAYGVAKLFLKQTRDGQQMEISGLFDGFKNDFGGTFILSLMATIFISLWTLLFIIPGIVKAYSYSMAYLIKADHPEYDWKKCIDESKRLMDGHKAELFVQDLSFLGWIIVGALCLGVGTLWVTAYMNAARSQFYNDLVARDFANSQQFAAPQSDAPQF